MALSGWEWVIILLAAIAILIWGPSKIPEFAKGLGRARAEFEKASKGEYSEESLSRTSDDETVILIAQALGIPTEGKTKGQIVSEIMANIKAAKSGSQV